MKFFKVLPYILATLLFGFIIYNLYVFVIQYRHENAVLKDMIGRLQADSRAAEVLVTKVEYDEKAARNLTTIKFLEYDAKGRPMSPQYFTFAGNIIQFQSLVIRFDDIDVRRGDQLRGKSAYLFWKIFMLDGKNTQEFEITPLASIPEGYRVAEPGDTFEKKLWAQFWKYALAPDSSKKSGIKNAQIEAPGTMFVPGILYTIRIEHDGGLRIDSQTLSPILKGEQLPR